MRSKLASPAVAVVGRRNSGKTTLVEALIGNLTQRGLDIGSVKHHGHAGFEIDVKGKDSYRHRHAGATETYIACPGQIAMVSSIDGEMECNSIVDRMPGHDLVIVEGYRNSGLPVIEVMRAQNPRDELVAHAFDAASRGEGSLDTDFVQLARLGSASGEDEWSIEEDIASKSVGASTVAVVTDIPVAHEAAKRFGIPSFDLSDVAGVSDFLCREFARERLTVAIQAGGENRRMGRSKATIVFDGEPLIKRLVRRMAPVADELIVTTNEPDQLQFLHDEFPRVNLRLVGDCCSQRGALPGLRTAFGAASNPLVAIIACDMVFASPRLLSAEYDRIVACGSDAVVPCNVHGFEPFHAIYRRDVCLEAVCSLMEHGAKRVQDLVDSVEAELFSQRDVLDAEPRGGCFVNVNTPEELADAEAIASRHR